MQSCKNTISEKIIIQVSDARVSRNPSDTLITYSLGSCIGVCAYDQNTRIGGLLHFQLPESKMNPERAQQVPFMFADTGMKLLVNKMLSMGANKKSLTVKIAGGAAMDNGPKGFDIGKRNYLGLRKILWKNGMFIDAEHVGGSEPRTMHMEIASGRVVVKCGCNNIIL